MPNIEERVLRLCYANKPITKNEDLAFVLGKCLIYKGNQLKVLLLRNHIDKNDIHCSQQKGFHSPSFT